MFDPQLKLSRKEGSPLKLRLPLSFSLPLGLMAAAFATSLIYLGRASFFGILLAAACFLAALYYEEWEFDQDAIRHRRGIRPFPRSRIYQTDAIENLTLHRRPSPRGDIYYGLSFDLLDGRRIVLDNSKDPFLESLAWELNKTLQIPLGFEGGMKEDEEPRD